MMAHLGHTTVTAENGEQAVDTLTAAYEDLDLVLMDCEMPVLDGFAATRRIRAWERAEGIPPVPVVALTGHSEGHLGDAMDAAGMQAHLAKPLRLDALAAVLAAQQADVARRRRALT